MLIIAGTMEVDPAQRDEILRGRHEAMRSSRAEPGCHDYVMSADPLRPEIIYLYERWETKENLAAHLTALRARAAASAESQPQMVRDIAQYEIAAVGAIGS